MRFRISIVFTYLFILTLFNLSFSQTPKDFSKMRSKWVHSVSKSTKKLPRLYLKQAMLVTPNENVFGQEAIRRHVVEHRLEFASLSSTESLQLFKHSDRKVLDIGYLNVEDEQKTVIDSLLYIVAWRKIDDTWLRELDIISPTDGVNFIDDEFEDERSMWLKYANGDDPEAMVDSMFFRDAVYLNNSEASKGLPAIAKRFDFIKNPAFHINLKNEKLVKIDDSTAIDIGNWMIPDFVGYYLIMWKKDAAGDWKISLYFNF